MGLIPSDLRPQSDADLARVFDRAREAWKRWPLRPRPKPQPFLQLSLPPEQDEPRGAA